MNLQQFLYGVSGVLFGILGTIVTVNLVNRSILDDDELVIGVVSLPSTRIDKEKYEKDFKKFLAKRLGSKVDLEVDLYEILPTTSFNEIQERIYKPIEDQEWDVVFALTPLSSLKADENEYTFLARMFWQDSEEPQPPVIFFVRSDSPIQEFEDFTRNGRVESYTLSGVDDRKANNFLKEITNSTTPQYAACKGISNAESLDSIDESNQNKPKIALGSPSRQESIFTFYIPLYHLYGSSFFADTDNSQCEILIKVLSGQADVGVGIPPIPFIKDALDQKVIREIQTVNQDKILPYSGVFLSPSLSKRDQIRISKLLLNVPEEMMQELHYIDNKKTAPNYDGLARVNKRVEEIMQCLNWQNSTQDEVVYLVDSRECPSSTQ